MDPAYSFEEMFNFLAQPHDKVGRTRFHLYPPDLFDPQRWSVWDSQDKRTLGYGPTPAAATASAMSALGIRPEVRS